MKCAIGERIGMANIKKMEDVAEEVKQAKKGNGKK